MAINPYLVREYSPEDWEMIEKWHYGHGTIPPPAEILPKLGVIVHQPTGKDFAAMWLYMDNSVGVCFVEHIVTVPGLGPSQARQSLERGLDYLRSFAASNDYGVLFIHTLPAIARRCEKLGFNRMKEGLTSMWRLTKGGI